jgi:hypothetical protein
MKIITNSTIITRTSNAEAKAKGIIPWEANFPEIKEKTIPLPNAA